MMKQMKKQKKQIKTQIVNRKTVNILKKIMKKYLMIKNIKKKKVYLMKIINNLITRQIIMKT